MSLPLAADPANYVFRQPFPDEVEVFPVLHLTQDATGFVWLLQERTLWRYDGTNLERVERVGKEQFTALAGDRLGNLWLGTRSSGLKLWDHATQTLRTWSSPTTEPSFASSILAIRRDARGAIWVLAGTGAVARIEPATGKSEVFSADELGAGKDGLTITALATSPDGQIWLGTDSGVMLRRHLDDEVFERQQLVGTRSRIAVLAAGANNELWIGTNDGRLLALDRTSLADRIVVDKITGTTLTRRVALTALVEDPQGHLWIGTEDGLQVLAPGGTAPESVRTDPEAQRPSTDAPIQALFLDRNGVLWVADEYGGLATTSTRASAFDLWDAGKERGNSLVTSITAAPDGSVWVGTHKGGVYRRLPSGVIEHYGQIASQENAAPGALDATAQATLVDRRGRLWIGTLSRGLTMIDLETGESKHYTEDRDNPHALSNAAVLTLFERADGKLWVGTFDGGLNLFDPETAQFSALRHDARDETSLSEDHVRSVLEDSAGRLWVGSRSSGLNLQLPGASGFEHFRNDPDDPRSIANDTIVAITEDRGGQLWLGTYLGLEKVVIENGQVTFEHYGEEQGLAGHKIFSVIEDESGFLWLSTSQGISRFERESSTFINLARSHGLPPGGYAYNAYARGAEGTLYYGSNYGVTAFHPARIKLAAKAPQIVLTSVLKLNEPMELPAPGKTPEEMTFSYSDSLLSFEFSLLDFVAPDENRYEHLLEGFDDEWMKLGNNRRANYSNLPPGSYTFRVRGANREGVWSAKDATLAFRVLPPIWATWWAYALYVALACSAVLAYARHQARKQRREALYTQRLEREVHRRTRELAAQNEKLRYANELLEVASVTDSLTGVRNRRFLLTTIDQDIALVDRSLASDDDDSRQDSAFVFILFDLDGFKEINDSYGHSAGDLVLFQVRDLLNQACRTSDTLIRWGGDEFLIVAREATRAHVEALAERIRQSVAEHLFDIGAAQPVQLTCSLGFACYPFVAASPRLYSWEEVIDIADRALYVAKRHGPNMWAGIFGTDQTEETPVEDLLVMIMERPELLGAEGSIRLVTSHPTPAQVELRTTEAGRN